MNSDPHHRISMQYLIIEAEQDEEFDHHKEYGGATVGCWIKNQTAKNAYHVAKGWIEENGWKVIRVDQHYPISKEDYTDDPQGEEYFDQALTDEEVFVFHTFPQEE